PEELRWFYQEGTSWIFPDFWQEFLQPIPEAERGDLMSAYHSRLTSADPAVQRVAARAWSQWEGRTSRLIPDPELVARFGSEAFSLAFARIECHYFKHDAWLGGERALLANIAPVRGIPGVI